MLWSFDLRNVQESIFDWEIVVYQYGSEIGEDLDEELKMMTLYNGLSEELKEDIIGEGRMLTDYASLRNEILEHVQRKIGIKVEKKQQEVLRER